MMFKLLSEAMLEIHETHRWILTNVLAIIAIICVKMIKVLKD